ncbi:hypothetical protein ISN44_As10g017870 [Arabidopsis suecica]|uniref:Uncharacterized protein n=1 Tax=Arabidopsis suecica TaxID=45249 RepID=A0A8T1ZXW0_ARASU|nr:hypothetical protein ISN44_As10g017870 [Arabidopsis suecica]
MRAYSFSERNGHLSPAEISHIERIHTNRSHHLRDTYFQNVEHWQQRKLKKQKQNLDRWRTSFATAYALITLKLHQTRHNENSAAALLEKDLSIAIGLRAKNRPSHIRPATMVTSQLRRKSKAPPAAPPTSVVDHQTTSILLCRAKRRTTKVATNRATPEPQQSLKPP